MGRIQEYSLINCAVNPQCGRERAFRLEPVLKPKTVVIVGGGPAGCECARVLALRGHRPILLEKGARLGGNLIPGGAPDFKEDDIALADWYAHTLSELDVDVRLCTPASAETVRALSPDAVIVATGSVPKRFSLGDDSHVYAAEQVLLKEKDPGQRVVVVGAGLVGCELALWLAKEGRQVTLVEALDQILAVNKPLCHANADMLEALLPYKGVDIRCGASVVKAGDGQCVIRSRATGEESALPADSVILCVGYASNGGLYDELADLPELYKLGDAKNVANIHNAIWEAYEVANHI